ncbi:uncharacterized protein LOC115223250 isoform X1 [Octopus sinensis]|uniref:Uncharacterized protein LOC115223250 isoform X1 n=1 Tax=Octopus sinensis TaxID=2607531 RepID=A0A7E6FK38_9MOLL|nr:uncharacterized protein LOC115223250 isoform X1 [Octopus sinensis]
MDRTDPQRRQPGIERTRNDDGQGSNGPATTAARDPTDPQRRQPGIQRTRNDGSQGSNGPATTAARDRTDPQRRQPGTRPPQILSLHFRQLLLTSAAWRTASCFPQIFTFHFRHSFETRRIGF